MPNLKRKFDLLIDQEKAKEQKDLKNLLIKAMFNMTPENENQNKLRTTN